MQHLQRINDIYKITVYKNDPEEYITFCSPECAKAVDDYLEYRKRCSVIIKPSAPLIRQVFNKLNPIVSANPRAMGVGSIENIIYRAIYDSGIREKKNMVKGQKRVLHEVMQSHGLRKFFNTQVVIEGKMSPLYAEFMMGHRSGLAMESYVRPTIQQLYDEYMKVVNNVTINEENRLRQENQTLKIKKDNLEARLDRLEQVYRDLL